MNVSRSIATAGKASRRVIPLVVAWLIALVCLVALAMRASSGHVLSLDVTLAEEVQDLPRAFGHLFSFENWLGDGLPLAAFTVVLAAVLYVRHFMFEAALVLSTFLVRAGDVLVKEAVREPRPSPNVINVRETANSFSFPSGHVVGVTLVFILFAVFAPRFVPKGWLVGVIQAISLILVGTIGLSRIWVGVHWPTDVVGGYLYALLFLIPALEVARRRHSDVMG